MSNDTTQHTPADVRERIRDAIREGVRYVAKADGAYLYETADRILVLLHTPRGEGEGEPVAWRVEYRRRGDGDARWYHLGTYTNEMDAHERARHAEGAMRVLECRTIPLYASPAAALRSEAQGDAEALAALVVRIWTRCKNEGPHYRETDEFWADFERAYQLAALRSEAQGDGPVGAVCANCGAPNAKIAGGELDPDEAVCSIECYDQLKELGCPQEHGSKYRPKPARRGEGGGK